MPAITGQEYLKRIKKSHPELWLDGQKVTTDLTEHPTFKGLLHSQAKLYDHQYKENKKDIMLWKSDTTGNLIGSSYLPPRTKEDLEKRRLAVQEWAGLSAGMLGRSPDYLNTALTALASASELFKLQDDMCMNNIKNYYEYAREHDISLTHTFVQPQVDRSQFYLEEPSEIIAARMIDKNDDGIVIHGARLLATQGGLTDEILVLPSGAKIPQIKGDHPHAYGFAIPNDTPGVKFLSRESYNYRSAHFDHPLGSRFEEMDTIVIFDHVTVPWDRVFMHGSIALANELYDGSSYFPLTTHQIISKNIIKLEFILGIVQMIVDTINIGDYQHVQEKVSEVIIALEAMKGFVTSSEVQAKENRWGLLVPNRMTLHAATLYYPKIYPRLIEIIQLLGASGLVSLPTEADFNSPIKDDLNYYLQTTTTSGEEKTRLFRLAWDLTMSAFGTRQTQYERYFFGDPVRLAGNLFHQYDTSAHVKRVKEFLKASD